MGSSMFTNGDGGGCGYGLLIINLWGCHWGSGWTCQLINMMGVDAFIDKKQELWGWTHLLILTNSDGAGCIN